MGEYDQGVAFFVEQVQMHVPPPYGITLAPRTGDALRLEIRRLDWDQDYVKTRSVPGSVWPICFEKVEVATLQEALAERNQPRVHESFELTVIGRQTVKALADLLLVEFRTAYKIKG